MVARLHRGAIVWLHQTNKQNKERIRLMADIPFDHAGCNGWAVYSSKNIAAGNSKNIHIAEVGIEEDDKIMDIQNI